MHQGKEIFKGEGGEKGHRPKKTLIIMLQVKRMSRLVIDSSCVFFPNFSNAPVEKGIYMLAGHRASLGPTFGMHYRA